MAIDREVTLCAGGGALALTTTEASIDLTALQGCVVAIWCDDQDVWFSGSTASTGTLVTAGALAANATALLADRVAVGTKVFRRIDNTVFLIAKTVTSTGTLKIKVVQRAGQ
jgi:hypothetical protein